MNTRPDIDQYYLSMAMLASSRSTCARRAVGCVLVDEHDRVLSIGYNGSPAGTPHCIETPCPGAHYRSGEGLDKCESIHAEISALTVADPRKVATAYITASPCIHCIKAFLATHCKRIVFIEQYPNWDIVKEQWEKTGRVWTHRNIKAELNIEI